MKYKNLLPGDPAPWFKQVCTSNPDFAFDTAAGRYIVLCFFGSAADPAARQRLVAVARDRAPLFDDHNICFFGVSADPNDEKQNRVAEHLPGRRFFWDYDLSVAKLYGAAPYDSEKEADGLAYRCLWYVLDPTLRVLRVIPFREDGGDSNELVSYLEALPRPSHFAGFELQAPILFLPNVFEPALCEKLIALYESHGGVDSGFMREHDGKTVAVKDYGHKKRSDYTIIEQDMIDETNGRIHRRIVPEIAKVHQFAVTRIERHIVGCYSAEDGGHFNAHRDNTTKGTAHRRFAVSINLNAEFEGGEVSFPEYGPRSFKPPPGGAVVFSCSLLHAVSAVRKGRRFAFLPFLYDDKAAEIREKNRGFIAGG